MSGFRFTIAIGDFDGTNPTSTIEVVPDKGFSKTVAPRVLVAKFGDGYEQRAQDGINPIEEMYTMSFATRPKGEIDDIVAFFEARGGVGSFILTISDDRKPVVGGEKTVKVVCTNYTQTWAYDDYYSCTASLKRTYSLDDWNA